MNNNKNYYWVGKYQGEKTYRLYSLKRYYIPSDNECEFYWAGVIKKKRIKKINKQNSFKK